MKSSEISQVNFDSKSLNGLRGLACGVELHWGNCTVFPVLGTVQNERVILDKLPKTFDT